MSESNNSMSQLLKSLFKIGDFVKVYKLFDAYITDIKEEDGHLLFQIKYVIDNRIENNISIDDLKVINLYENTIHESRSDRIRSSNDNNSGQANNQQNTTDINDTETSENNTNKTVEEGNSDEEENSSDENDSPELSEFKNILKESFNFKEFKSTSNQNKLYLYLKNGYNSYGKGWIRKVIQQKEVNVKSYLTPVEKTILSLITSMFCGYSSIKGVL